MVLYKLLGRLPVPCTDLEEWAKAFATASSLVNKTDVGGIGVVSTVFLGLDHSHCPDGPPLLFETMIFADDFGGGYIERCTTWDEAEAMHERAVVVLMAWVVAATTELAAATASKLEQEQQP